MRYYEASNGQRGYYEPNRGVISNPHPINMREEWIEFLVAYYRKILPGAALHLYYRWAEIALDNRLTDMGDYLSL